MVGVSSATTLLGAGLSLLLFRGVMLLPVHTAGIAGLPQARCLCKGANRDGGFISPLVPSPIDRAMVSKAGFMKPSVSRYLVEI